MNTSSSEAIQGILLNLLQQQQQHQGSPEHPHTHENSTQNQLPSQYAQESTTPEAGQTPISTLISRLTQPQSQGDTSTSYTDEYSAKNNSWAATPAVPNLGSSATPDITSMLDPQVVEQVRKALSNPQPGSTETFSGTQNENFGLSESTLGDGMQGSKVTTSSMPDALTSRNGAESHALLEETEIQGNSVHVQQQTVSLLARGSNMTKPNFISAGPLDAMDEYDPIAALSSPVTFSRPENHYSGYQYTPVMSHRPHGNPMRPINSYSHVQHPTHYRPHRPLVRHPRPRPILHRNVSHGIQPSPAWSDWSMPYSTPNYSRAGNQTLKRNVSESPSSCIKNPPGGVGTTSAENSEPPPKLRRLTASDPLTPEVLVNLGKLLQDSKIYQRVKAMKQEQISLETQFHEKRSEQLRRHHIAQDVLADESQRELLDREQAAEIAYLDKVIADDLVALVTKQQKELGDMGFPYMQPTEDPDLMRRQLPVIEILTHTLSR